jgi:DNA-binding CsgD family transcriptional regulator
MTIVDDLSPLRNKPFVAAIDKLEELTAQSGRAFLIGAGCSKCAGLPLMEELTEKVLGSATLDVTAKEILEGIKLLFEGTSDANIEDYLSELIDLLGAGANGYMLKSAKGEQLVQAIRFVKAGEFVSQSLIAQKMFRRMRRQLIALDFGEHLTTRESEVLRLAAKGRNNRDIAAQLGVGERTVKGHLMSIFDKMHVNSRTEAVMQALKRGWINIDDD